MSLRHVARYFLRTVAVCALGASFAGGCSRQGEGERCDRHSAGENDNDCDSGLVCTICEELQDGSVDRCCPPLNSPYSDSRCTPGSTDTLACRTISGTGGSGGTGNAPAAGAAGEENGGAGAVAGAEPSGAGAPSESQGGAGAGG